MREPESNVTASVNSFTAADVEAILRERGWLQSDADASVGGSAGLLEPARSWMAEAAALLGPHVADREALVRLLSLIFDYDAHKVLTSRDCQEVLTREGARDVLRALATEILGGGQVDSSRLKEIVAALKVALPYSSRELFHPLRAALTGCVGGGELDRVVLLLDRAAGIEGFAPVKSVRVRILEFCAALD